MTTPADQTADGPRHCHYVSSLLQRQARGNQRAAALPCLNNDNSPGQAADQTIPLRKMVRPGRNERGVLAENQATPLNDLFRQIAVLSRIEPSQTATEHRRGQATRERRPMRCSIDASCQPADYHPSFFADVLSQCHGNFTAKMGTAPRTHHCYGRPQKLLQVAPEKKQGGWIRYLKKQLWKLVRLGCDHLYMMFTTQLVQRDRLPPVALANQTFGCTVMPPRQQLPTPVAAFGLHKAGKKRRAQRLTQISPPKRKGLNRT